jgi:hypothetical protein
LIKPVIAALTGEMIEEIPDFSPARSFLQRDKKIRTPHISVVFGDLIFQYQMVSERVPGQLGDQAMVLVQVRTTMGKNHVRRYLSLQFLELFFNFAAKVREKPVPEPFYDYAFPLRLFQESLRALLGLFSSSLIGAEDYPVKDRIFMVFRQLEDRPAAAYFDVVAVRAQA